MSFCFSSDGKLPASIAAKMQAVADARNQAGCTDKSGNHHRTAEKAAFVDDLNAHIAAGSNASEVDSLTNRKADLKRAGKF